jgi:hypothetical protein
MIKMSNFAGIKIILSEQKQVKFGLSWHVIYTNATDKY